TIKSLADEASGLLHLVLGPYVCYSRRRFVLVALCLVLDDIADIELQPPAISTVARLAIELQCADRSAPGGKRHGDHARAAAFAAAQDGLQRRQLPHLPGLQVQEVTGLVVAPHGRGVKRKSDRLPERELQFRLRKRHVLPFFQMLRHHTESEWRVTSGE